MLLRSIGEVYMYIFTCMHIYIYVHIFQCKEKMHLHKELEQKWEDREHYLDC